MYYSLFRHTGEPYNLNNPKFHLSLWDNGAIGNCILLSYVSFVNIHYFDFFCFILNYSYDYQVQ